MKSYQWSTVRDVSSPRSWFRFASKAVTPLRLCCYSNIIDAFPAVSAPASLP
jgi:hypothetical protein